MNRQRDPRLGTAFVEFALVAAFILTPLIVGLMSFGFTLTRSLQVAQLTRDIGRMVVRGVDFSQQGNQDLITGAPNTPNARGVAKGLRMKPNKGHVEGSTEGDGVLILSTLTAVPDTCKCNNAGHIVLSRRIVIGNSTLHTTSFGNPAPGLVGREDGVVQNYLNNPTTRVDNFSSIMPMESGELAYLVEAKFRFPDLALAGFHPNPGVYWRGIF